MRFSLIYLVTVWAKVAKYLCEEHAVFEFSLSQTLHQHGVNIRFLDRIYMHLSGNHELSWKVLVGTEMYARIFKRELRELLRASAGESESRRIVASFLTSIRTSYAFWKDRAPLLLSSEPLWANCNPTFELELLCVRLVNMLGVQVARVGSLQGPVCGTTGFLGFNLSFVLPVDIVRWDPVVRESGELHKGARGCLF